MFNFKYLFFLSPKFCSTFLLPLVWFRVSQVMFYKLTWWTIWNCFKLHRVYSVFKLRRVKSYVLVGIWTCDIVLISWPSVDTKVQSNRWHRFLLLHPVYYFEIFLLLQLIITVEFGTQYTTAEAEMQGNSQTFYFNGTRALE